MKSGTDLAQKRDPAAAQSAVRVIKVWRRYRSPDIDGLRAVREEVPLEKMP
jgi:hypothetical protein